MTNQEARSAALLAARKAGIMPAVESAMRSFLDTERNFILTKGQTTVNLEDKRFDAEASQQTAARIENLTSKLIDAFKSKSR